MLYWPFFKKINKINKINSEEEIIVHTQFTGFGDDGNELRKPGSVKINTRPEDTQKCNYNYISRI
jgi:hypothetical protein